MNGNRTRVLLVDDHGDSLEITAKLLRLEGYEVATAGSCRQAVELARQSQFDLLVTDLGLPDGTGMELFGELNSLYNLPGVAMTAHGESWFLEGARDGGFARHLFKPFVFSDLLDAVRSSLEHGRAPSGPRRQVEASELPPS